MTRNRVRRSSGRRTTFGSGVAFGLVSAGLVGTSVNTEKAVMEPLCTNRVTSPISAMSCGPRESPTPRMAMTTGYSGRWAARVRISRLSCSRDLETAFSESMACQIIVLVRASLGSMAIRSFASVWISMARLGLEL